MQELTESTSEPSGTSVLDLSSTVSRDVVDELTATRPWVFLVATLGTLAGVGTLLLSGGTLLAIQMEQEGFDALLPIAVWGFLIGACWFLLPSLRLWRLGTFISRLEVSRAMGDFESALEAQLLFWKLVAILAMSTLLILLSRPSF